VFADWGARDAIFAFDQTPSLIQYQRVEATRILAKEMLTLGAEFKRSETMLLQRRGQKVFPRENTSEICKKSLKITPAQESISEPPASIPPQFRGSEWRK